MEESSAEHDGSDELILVHHLIKPSHLLTLFSNTKCQNNHNVVQELGVQRRVTCVVFSVYYARKFIM